MKILTSFTNECIATRGEQSGYPVPLGPNYLEPVPEPVGLVPKFLEPAPELDNLVCLMYQGKRKGHYSGKTMQRPHTWQ